MASYLIEPRDITLAMINHDETVGSRTRAFGLKDKVRAKALELNVVPQYQQYVCHIDCVRMDKTNAKVFCQTSSDTPKYAQSLLSSSFVMLVSRSIITQTVSYARQCCCMSTDMYQYASLPTGISKCSVENTHRDSA